jgi:hypothetical protein
MKARFLSQVLGAGASLLLCAQASFAIELTQYIKSAPQGLPKSDVGLNFAAQSLDINGVITTQRVGDTTLVMPQLVSSYALAPDLKFESRAIFGNWNQNSSSRSDDIETKLIARSVLPMLSEVQGSIRRDAAGESHRKLRLNMQDTTLPVFGWQPVVLKANASVEHIGVGKLPGSIVTGVESALVQKSPSSSALNQLGFKYYTQTGGTEYQRQAAAFSHSWAQSKIFRLGLEYELMHDEDVNLQSTVRFTWKGLF